MSEEQRPRVSEKTVFSIDGAVPYLASLTLKTGMTIKGKPASLHFTNWKTH
jgi:hypothetical protein